MSRTRYIVAIALTMLFAGGPVLAQAGDGEMPPPRERRQQMRAVRIDPQRDETLQAIRAAVEPTEQQEASILAQYTKLRKDQRAIMRDALAAVRGDEGRRDGQREFNRENIRKARQIAAEMIDALNTGFLESCRDLLRADQHEAWDACASQLDLRMNRRRGPGIAPTTAPAARFAVLGGCPATLDLAAFWVFLRLWVLRAGWFLARSSGVCCGMTSSSL